MFDEFLDGYPDVFGDLAQQEGGKIPAFVVGHSGLAAVRMLELAVGALLANEIKAQIPESPLGFGRFEDGNPAHGISDSDGLGADELCLQVRFAILEQHGNNFTEVFVQFVERLSLGVCAGKSGNVSDKQTGFGTPFDNGGERLHWWRI